MICSARINQLDEIFSIEKTSFIRPWTKNQIKKDLQDCLSSENWVYELNGNVVGYIFVSKIEDQFHLNNIAVHPDFLKKKIGSSLIKHIIMRAKNRKINFILLEVSINNISAQRCYKSLGFVQVGIRRNYYSQGDDAILYDLEIV